MNKVGFVFTEKEILYIGDEVKFDLDKMYISNSTGDTTDTKSKKEAC